MLSFTDRSPGPMATQGDIEARGSHSWCGALEHPG